MVDVVYGAIVVPSGYSNQNSYSPAERSAGIVVTYKSPSGEDCCIVILWSMPLPVMCKYVGFDCMNVELGTLGCTRVMPIPIG